MTLDLKNTQQLMVLAGHELHHVCLLNSEFIKAVRKLLNHREEPREQKYIEKYAMMHLKMRFRSLN